MLAVFFVGREMKHQLVRPDRAIKSKSTIHQVSRVPTVHDKCRLEIATSRPRKNWEGPAAWAQGRNVAPLKAK